MAHPNKTFGLHEVYSGKPELRSQNPITGLYDSKKDLIDDLKAMVEDAQTYPVKNA